MAPKAKDFILYILFKALKCLVISGDTQDFLIGSLSFDVLYGMSNKCSVDCVFQFLINPPYKYAQQKAVSLQAWNV